jgi:hypothetical protein
MNAALHLNEANFGIPIKRVALKIKRKRKGFEDTASDMLTLYGDAMRTVKKMTNLVWYLTDQNYLVCGGSAHDVPEITLWLVVDDNLPWLAEWTMREFRNDFGTPFRIVGNELDHMRCLILLKEGKQEAKSVSD